MIDAATIPTAAVHWPAAVRIINSRFPPISLFEDVADPADWPLLMSAEQKTNPRLMETIGRLDLVPAHRRVGGPGASVLMAPFTHASPDRPSRFSDGRYGVLYCGDRFEVALFETMHHHARFMAATRERPGWASQFREYLLTVRATLSDVRGIPEAAAIADPASYTLAQAVGSALRDRGADGVVYPSARYPGGDCAALFHPDVASAPIQGRHLDYHWNGERVDYYRIPATGAVFAVEP